MCVDYYCCLFVMCARVNSVWTIWLYVPRFTFAWTSWGSNLEIVGFSSPVLHAIAGVVPVWINSRNSGVISGR
jgi:hypothetical protein